MLFDSRISGSLVIFQRQVCSETFALCVYVYIYAARREIFFNWPVCISGWFMVLLVRKYDSCTKLYFLYIYMRFGLFENYIFLESVYYHDTSLSVIFILGKTVNIAILQS